MAPGISAAPPGTCAVASTASRYVRNAADVKNSEPAKKVAAAGRDPTAAAYAGTLPRAKSSDPTANRTAIHHPRARGAHQVDPAATPAPPCFRERRDSQRATRPSGRRCSTNVTKGPT
ncbi:MAG TPA: hypothetical protein VES02_10300 [Dermatophilaceae bacterium]|nr:hypothetical protein [Dermatophilaceae bacterium]